MAKKSFSVYGILGRRVRVDDSYATARKLVRLFRDRILDADEKGAVALKLSVADPDGFCAAFGEDSPRAFREVLRKAYGASDKPSKVLIDLEQDDARIKATMLQAYGQTPEQFESMPYRDVCSYILMSPHETPMGQAVYYRSAKRPKRTKWNADEIRRFDKLRRFYRIRSEDG